jgi:hypothetical protein
MKTYHNIIRFLFLILSIYCITVTNEVIYILTSVILIFSLLYFYEVVINYVRFKKFTSLDISAMKYGTIIMAFGLVLSLLEHSQIIENQHSIGTILTRLGMAIFLTIGYFIYKNFLNKTK